MAKEFTSTSPRTRGTSGIQFAQIKDFTGGLNFRADQFQLAPNESPFILNMEVDPRGGVFSRAGYMNFNTSGVSGTWNPKVLFNYKYPADPHIMFSTGFVTSGSVDGKVMYANSASHNFVNLNSAVSTPLAVKSLNGASFTQWEDTLYIALGKDATQMYKWTVGNTYATALLASSPTWQQYTLPVGGYMPRAELSITHANKLFVANTKEYNNDATPSLTAFPNRLRWSHESLPEDWYIDDYIDIIAGGEGIRGLAVVDGQLLIFKPKAVYLLMGYDADSFQLVEVSKFVGIDTPQQCVEGDGGVYFFDYPKGLFFFDRNGMQNIYERLEPTVTQNQINAQQLAKVTLGFVNNRLWMSAPYDLKGSGAAQTTSTVNFVFDRSIGQRGAYTMFQSADEFGLYAGCDWYDNVRYVQNKTFVRPLYVVRNVETDTQLIINTFHDFNSTNIVSPSTLVLDAQQSGGLYNTAQFDSAIYGIDILPTTIQAGARLKRAKAVQIQFLGPTDTNSNPLVVPGRYWGINSIAYKFKSRQVRSSK